MTAPSASPASPSRPSAEVGVTRLGYSLGSPMKLLRHQEAAKRSHEVTERKRAERDPLVQAVMDRFPGATIVGVRTPEREQNSRR